MRVATISVPAAANSCILVHSSGAEIEFSSKWTGYLYTVAGMGNVPCVRSDRRSPENPPGLSASARSSHVHRVTSVFPLSQAVLERMHISLRYGGIIEKSIGAIYNPTAERVSQTVSLL